MKIPRAELIENDVHCGNHVQMKIIRQDRWSLVKEVVFKWDDGKRYRVSFNAPATEIQDYVQPWDDEEVECQEVELREVTRKEWVDV